MVEIQELRRQILMALEDLEKKKSALTMEGLDLEKRGYDVITGLINSMYAWILLSFVPVMLQSKFVGTDLWSIFGGLLILAVGLGSVFVIDWPRIRLVIGLMEDFNRKETTFIEDAKQLAIQLQKSQKACQSKVAPVMEQDFSANDGNIANISHDTDWLSRQLFFEKRLENIRMCNNYGDFKGELMSYIKWIAIVGIVLISCLVMVLYYFYDRSR